MKLVLLTANYPYGQGGDNSFINNEIEALMQPFDEVVVVSTGIGALRKDIPQGLKVINCPINVKNLFKMVAAAFLSFDKDARKAHKELKTLYPNIGFITRFKQIFKHNYAFKCMEKTLIKECADADVVYSYWLSSRAYAYARVKKDKDYSNVFLSRSHRFDCYLSCNAYLPYRNFICSELDEIVFISNDGREAFESETCPVLDKKCRFSVHYLGVNKDAEEEDYRIGNSLNIVTCSAIISVKRLDILIDALSKIVDVQINWTHFGGGELTTEISVLAHSRLDDKPNISYCFKGSVNNATILEYYRNNSIDLIINTSDSEGIPVSIMEAFSFGIPAITRDVGGLREINCGNNGGYLLSANATAQDFANAITNFAKKPHEEILAKRKEVKDIFNCHFSKQAIKSYCKTIQSMCKN